MKRLLFSLLAVAACIINVSAADDIRLGYCGEIESGFGEAGASVTPWITLTQEKLGPYAGCSIKAVRLGLRSKASNVTLYIRRDMNDKDNLATVKAGKLDEGWQTIELESPFEISADGNLAIGYKASFSKAKGAGYTDGKIDDASHVYTNTTSSWSDINGAFCIEAILTSTGLPANEMGIISLSDGVLPFGSDFTALTARVENLGLDPVTSFTYSISVDGVNVSETTEPLNLNVNEKKDIEVRVPSAGIGRHEVVMTILKVNGEPDSFDGNNTATAIVTERDPAFRRRVVVEEGTGTWCGWCPRGIVGLEMMAEKYPEQFIGIAVHSGQDPMRVSDFEPLLNKIISYPGCIVDRHTSGDPYEDIERLVNAELNEECHVAYDMTAALKDSQVVTKSRIMTDRDMKASSLYFAFTVIEDDVLIVGDPAYIQSNSYSGSEISMGGWQDLPNLVANYKFQDVARGIYSSYAGEPLLSQDLVENEEQYVEYTFDLPTNVLDVNNVYIVGQVIDGSNGFILNAAKYKLTGESGVETIDSDNTKVIHTEWYDINGKYISPESYRGIAVRIDRMADGSMTSHKVIVR